MADSLMDSDVFDYSEYEKADQQFRLVEEKLPRDAVSALAEEVVRRLKFRMPKTGRKEDLPSSEEIDQLCDALLSSEEGAAEKFILNVRRDGADIHLVYLGFVAGAARRLGELWNDDEISFIDVTLASAQLYRIIRGLRHIVAPGIIDGRDERPALFALTPGETHTLGIAMATDVFRLEGWDVDMMIGLDHDVLVDDAERRNYQVIVLVANSDGMLKPLARLVLALRITQPLAHVLVAGNILDDYPDIAEIVGADAVMKDIETGVATLRGMLDQSGLEIAD